MFVRVRRYVSVRGYVSAVLGALTNCFTNNLLCSETWTTRHVLFITNNECAVPCAGVMYILMDLCACVRACVGPVGRHE